MLSYFIYSSRSKKYGLILTGRLKGLDWFELKEQEFTQKQMLQMFSVHV